MWPNLSLRRRIGLSFLERQRGKKRDTHPPARCCRQRQRQDDVLLSVPTHRPLNSMIYILNSGATFYVNPFSFSASGIRYIWLRT